MSPDGSCLFEALTEGLRRLGRHGQTAGRNELAAWLSSNTRTQVAGISLADWIRWDSDQNWAVRRYVAILRTPRFWGGELEIVACSIRNSVNVSVFVASTARPGFYERIASYERPGVSETVSLLYVHGRHYELLLTRTRVPYGGANTRGD
jgi:hypothetical protein